MFLHLILSCTRDNIIVCCLNVRFIYQIRSSYLLVTVSVSEVLPEAWEWILECTAGDEGPIADISCMSIFSACFGLPTCVQLAATTWSAQIWISGWILTHFDVKTILWLENWRSYKIFFDKKYFSYCTLLVNALLHCAMCYKTTEKLWQIYLFKIYCHFERFNETDTLCFTLTPRRILCTESLRTLKSKKT